MSDIFKNSPTFRLFKREPSFTEGASRLIDLGANIQDYNISQTGSEADYEALMSDWKAVGSDLNSAMKVYEQEFAKAG